MKHLVFIILLTLSACGTTDTINPHQEDEGSILVDSVDSTEWEYTDITYTVKNQGQTTYWYVIKHTRVMFVYLDGELLKSSWCPYRNEEGEIIYMYNRLYENTEAVEGQLLEWRVNKKTVKSAYLGKKS